MIILLIIAMITLSGCLEMPSVYPLFTEQTAVTEPRLLGFWQTKDGKEQMVMKQTGDREYRLTYIDEQGEASLWAVRVTKLGETLVADMVTVKNDSSIIPAHYFLALSFDSRTLKVWFLDSKVLREKAVKEGVGFVRGKKDEVVLTAPTSSLAAFLKKNLLDEMKKDPDEEFFPLK